MGSPNLVTKRIVNEKNKTEGYVLKTRGKEQKVTTEELIKLVENYPKSVLVDMPGAKDNPVYLSVIEGEPDKNGNIKKSLRTVWDDQIKNNLKELKAIKPSTASKFKEFKTPEKKLVAV